MVGTEDHSNGVILSLGTWQPFFFFFFPLGTVFIATVSLHQPYPSRLPQNHLCIASW